MKVDFADIEFGSYEPYMEATSSGRKFRVVEVCVTMDDGKERAYTIAESALETELARLGKIDGAIDNSIAYYADNNDMMYYILECITGEEIV